MGAQQQELTTKVTTETLLIGSDRRQRITQNEL